MTLANRLRTALQDGGGSVPDLIIGDLRDDGMTDVAPTPAAVLLAVTDRPRPGLILTQRTASLRKHAGQVALPGGRIDPGDRDAAAAALREAHEEIALPPTMVDVIGLTDCYQTVSGFIIQPVIGVVPPDLTLTPEPGEVAAIFEAPLDYLLDPANHGIANVEWLGRNRQYYEIMWQEFRIWGATAAMLVNLSRRLRWTA